MMDQRSRTAQTLAGRRIFLVEDDFLIGDAMCDMLQSAGAEISGPFGRPCDALNAIRQPDFAADAAILDVDLHGEKSYQVADALIRLGVPFIFTTGYAVDAVDPAYRAYRRYEKPLSGRVLIPVLAEIAAGGNAPK